MFTKISYKYFFVIFVALLLVFYFSGYRLVKKVEATPMLNGILVFNVKFSDSKWKMSYEFGKSINLENFQGSTDSLENNYFYQEGILKEISEISPKLSDVNNFSISKDEKLIAYTSKEEKTLSIYELSRTPKITLKKVFETKVDAQKPFFSPDSKFIGMQSFTLNKESGYPDYKIIFYEIGEEKLIKHKEVINLEPQRFMDINIESWTNNDL